MRLGVTVGLTGLSALLPGAGFLYAGRRALGLLVLGVWLAIAAVGGWYVGGRGRQAALDLAFDPSRVRVFAIVLTGVTLAWALVVYLSYRAVRRRDEPRWHTAVGHLWVGVLCLAVAVPAGQVTRAALAHAELVDTVFAGPRSSTIPTGTSKEDPWAGQGRVNVLLLGGDAGEGRTGTRTDTVILVSVGTDRGRTVMFSLPRNLMYAQFPEDSPLHEIYPDGYVGEGGGGMLNAIYDYIPSLHPGILGDSSDEGADAMKAAVSGTLGVPVDYYVKVDLAGFEEVVDAIGGVTVNVNEPVAIEGNTDRGIPPRGWIEPGADRHLDGYHALWFARGRYGSDDYERMERQRCVIAAIVERADPLNLLTRYQELAAAGQKVVETDIPLELAPAFADLGLKMKNASMKSVVFQTSESFSSADPDFEWMQRVVKRNIRPRTGNGGGGEGQVRQVDDAGDAGDADAGAEAGDDGEDIAEEPAEACAYDPVEFDPEDYVNYGEEVIVARERPAREKEVWTIVSEEPAD